MRKYGLKSALERRDMQRIAKILDDLIISKDDSWIVQEKLELVFSAISSPTMDQELLNLLLLHCSKSESILRNSLGFGNPEIVKSLVEAGANIHYRSEGNHDALLDAVYHRALHHDEHLLDLIKFLIDSGVSVVGKSDYGETAIHRLSHVGRFDAVQVLLEAGADSSELRFTPLIDAVAFGTLADIERVAASGADLEERDRCKRTAWLVAVQVGDIAKAKLLRDFGADVNAKGPSDEPALFYAVKNHHSAMLEGLIQSGAGVNQSDKNSDTPLSTAAESGNEEAVDILLKAGADANQRCHMDTTALYDTHAGNIALMLLRAGADPHDLQDTARRSILGYPPEPDQDELLLVTKQEFRKYRSPRYGRANPEQMNNPFWDAMLRTGVNAYTGGCAFGSKDDWQKRNYKATWCAQRFGQSITFLPDGRIVQIGGEHEDFSDSDFYIYNDVFVHHPDGSASIYGYPKSVFPPTDSHTANLIGNHIYVIGTIGYMNHRKYGKTFVHRLNVDTFVMERLKTTGENPGWIYEHRAVLLDATRIEITGGTILTEVNGVEQASKNQRTYILDTESLVWYIEATS